MTRMLGKRAAVHRPGALMLASYLPAKREPIPEKVDNYSAIGGWGMMANDRIGNCVPAETIISGPAQSMAYRSSYAGDMLTITLASGKRLTVTPNHQVLTDSGFVAAKFVKNGDNLISTRGPQVFPRGALGAAEGHVDYSPAPAEQKFSSLLVAGGTRRKIMPIPVHFHGDGQFLDGEIDVVATDGFLGHEAHSALREPHAENEVRAARHLQRVLQSTRPSLKRLLVPFGPANGDVRFRGNGAPLRNGHPRISEANGLRYRAEGNASRHHDLFEATAIDAGVLMERLDRLAGDVALDQVGTVAPFVPERQSGGLKAAAPLHASFIEAPADGLRTDAKFARELQERFAGLVAADRVINVESQSFSGHVYDFSTDPQWYVANGVLTHNCTCAAAGHMIQAWTKLSCNREVQLADDTIIGAYSAITGYTPDNPDSDQGAVEADVLDYWKHTGFGGHKIEAYATIETSSEYQVQLAVYLFGAVYSGLALPASAQDQTMWTAVHGSGSAPGSWGGHAVPLLGYDQNRATCISWGAPLDMTWSFWTRYADEAYACLSPDWVDEVSKLAPNHLDWQRLLDDLQSNFRPA